MSEGFGRVDGELDAIRKRLDALEALLPQAVLDLIQGDPHQWSNRPCPTCQPITTMIGRPFGCYRYQAEQVRTSKTTAAVIITERDGKQYAGPLPKIER